MAAGGDGWSGCEAVFCRVLLDFLTWLEQELPRGRFHPPSDGGHVRRCGAWPPLGAAAAENPPAKATARLQEGSLLTEASQPVKSPIVTKGACAEAVGVLKYELVCMVA